MAKLFPKAECTMFIRPLSELPWVEDNFNQMGKNMAKKKSWCEKLEDSKDLPKIEKITDKMSKRWGTGTVVIPAPVEVDEIMRKVPEGKLVTINDIRAALARKHGATIGCPITTGIFAWIAANAAEERTQKGERDITPYWRTLKTGGVINEKYPSGVEAQRRLLEKEGHEVVQKGKNFVVVNYEKSLAKL
jgi:alkylated DNA nucleotide flippase Atl1